MLQTKPGSCLLRRRMEEDCRAWGCREETLRARNVPVEFESGSERRYGGGLGVESTQIGHIHQMI